VQVDLTGRWSGQIRYNVLLHRDPQTLMPVYEARFLPVEVRIDEHSSEGAPAGWSYLSGRMGAGNCMLSGRFEGSVFAGDDVSGPRPFPRVTFDGVGQSDAGLDVAIRVLGDLREDKVMQGFALFGGFESRVPCKPAGMLALELVRMP
jgi:hypothetical protein